MSRRALTALMAAEAAWRAADAARSSAARDTQRLAEDDQILCDAIRDAERASDRIAVRLRQLAREETR